MANLSKTLARPYTDEWYTTPEFVSALGRLDLDPCAGSNTRHARRNIRRPQNGLIVEWRGRVWCNPPYSDKEGWIEKIIAHGNGYLLIFSITETRLYQRAAAACDGIFFPLRRIQFINHNGKNPPFGSALFCFGKANTAAVRKSKLSGHLTTRIERIG